MAAGATEQELAARAARLKEDAELREKVNARLDDLIDAMPELQASHSGAQLLLVGGGPRDESLRKQAAASSAAGSIHFTGRVPHSQVERYYSLIDVLAYPRKASRLTDLVTPLKPLEAMGQAIFQPLVVTGLEMQSVDALDGAPVTPV